MDSLALLNTVNIDSHTVPTDAAVDTIVASATAVGMGGVAIVRVSGNKSAVLTLVNKILKTSLKPRYAYYGNFYNSQGVILDKGLALYFAAPNSYTGEHVLELHCHGGFIVINNIIEEIIGSDSNIRLAEPGEFTKRAWLNGKMDLAQVEAVADVINATSKQAAQAAVNTLVGEFSLIINTFLEELIHLRVYVEAAIDFSDEQIDFIRLGEIKERVLLLTDKLQKIIAQTKQGVIIQEGLDIVIAGRPNAGKSSLLNALCHSDEAIVTDIAGTTRDVIKTHISIKGVPVNLFDTAGIRQSDDRVEQEGIKKAIKAIDNAQLVLLLIDGSLPEYRNLSLDEIIEKEFENINYANLKSKYNDQVNKNDFILIVNKIDKVFRLSKIDPVNQDVLFISAKDKLGINELEDLILKKCGYLQTAEGRFTARRRHLISLNEVAVCLVKATELLNSDAYQDLIAEELRLAQEALASITGEFSSDDLLGNIFSSFCIGK